MAYGSFAKVNISICESTRHHVTNVKGQFDHQGPVYHHVPNVRGHSEQQFHKSSAEVFSNNMVQL